MRKDDITDIESFKNVKKQFDDEFMHDDRIIKINTDLCSIDEVVDIIMNKIKIR